MKRILVADDKASSRELIRMLLEPEGYEISEAVDGQEAVEMALANVPDLIGRASCRERVSKQV